MARQTDPKMTAIESVIFTDPRRRGRSFHGEPPGEVPGSVRRQGVRGKWVRVFIVGSTGRNG